jgi:hypothetical protein
MFIRLISCGALVLGAALLGTGCSPTAEAQQTAALEEGKKADGQFCGGFAAIQCPEGYTCVDDPKDDCDPAQGGADCGGICQQEPKKPACDDPDRTYVSRDPDQCAAIRFFCDPGKVPFFDDCGCGCEPEK